MSREDFNLKSSPLLAHHHHVLHHHKIRRYTHPHPANEEKIVNSNCLCAVLLAYIKKQICPEIGENIDLSTEIGEVLDLSSKPKEIARKHIEARMSYIVVKIVEEGEESMYVSLLDSGEKVKFSSIFILMKLRMGCRGL